MKADSILNFSHSYLRVLDSIPMGKIKKVVGKWADKFLRVWSGHGHEKGMRLSVAKEGESHAEYAIYSIYRRMAMEWN